ncbi:MAG: hypothetical protein JKY52_19140, partial [Flavobacteriales bacterium]|nr:hypothetical protein [Flavobacteriales bacterium]
CGALDAFDGESSVLLFFQTIAKLIIAIFIWLVGVAVFYILKRKKKINIPLYYSILTIVSLYFFIIKAIHREPEVNRDLKEIICAKGSDDGMELRFTFLNRVEYDFINSSSNWLPALPEGADSINIDYYRDSFIGDFHLIIDVSIPIGGELDSTKYPKWEKHENRYRYEDFET